MKSILMAAIAALFFASLASPAEAKMKCNSDNDGRTVCVGASASAREPVYSRRQMRKQYRRVAARDANGNSVVRSNIFRAYIGRATTSRECLRSNTRAILEAAERHFGVTFKLASTCRPGAVIAGSNKPSLHRDGLAADVKVPRGMSKAKVARWFYDNASGLTMTYRNMAHVHFDTGPYHKLVRGADAYGGRRNARRHYQKHARL